MYEFDIPGSDYDGGLGRMIDRCDQKTANKAIGYS